MFPGIVWNMIGRKDELYRPNNVNQFKNLSKKMIPSFLPEAGQKRNEVFWVDMLAEMDKVEVSQEEKEDLLPFHKGYLYSTNFMVAVQSIFFEVVYVAQPHFFDT
jgi:hypothetical protein